MTKNNEKFFLSSFRKSDRCDKDRTQLVLFTGHNQKNTGLAEYFESIYYPTNTYIFWEKRQNNTYWIF